MISSMEENLGGMRKNSSCCYFSPNILFCSFARPFAHNYLEQHLPPTSVAKLEKSMQEIEIGSKTIVFAGMV